MVADAFAAAVAVAEAVFEVFIVESVDSTCALLLLLLVSHL